MVVTLRADEEQARWQSGHESCAAARAARSTGEGGGRVTAAKGDTCAELAAKKGTEDPEGAFTSVPPSAATLLLPEGGKTTAGAAFSDWAEGGAARMPPAGLERVSATTLDWPAMCRTVGENSAI